jgi:hypothetical protein
MSEWAGLIVVGAACLLVVAAWLAWLAVSSRRR